MKNKIIGKAVLALFLSMLLSGCNTSSVSDGYIKPEITKVGTMALISKQSNEDYKYWVFHNVAGYEDFVFWDMGANQGQGCTVDTYVYNTQIVHLKDKGYELGYPIVKFVEEQASANLMSYYTQGIVLNEWQENEEGEKQRYTDYKSEVYVVKDIDEREWTFMVYTYEYETEEEAKAYYYNIMGVTAIADDWLIMELNGKVDGNQTNKAKHAEILAEFVEIYNFKDVLTGNAVEKLIGID